MATVEQTRQATTNGTGATIAVENPATGEIVAHVPDMGPEQVAELARNARAAQPAWEALGFEGRGEVMLEMRGWLVRNRDRMLRTIVEETGKTIDDAQNLELYYTADSLGFWGKKAGSYLADERIRSHSVFVLGKKLYIRYKPVGVVGVIGPWNYPLSNSFADCIPALMAGNAVILKPSEVTPLTSLFVEEGLRASGIPQGVFQVATGGGGTGSALVDEANMIHFTGSTATGKKVMARASETLTPVSLELGGKDPMLVLRDADVERAANAAVFYSMANGGQTCIAVERVYVEEPIYDQFVNKVVEKTRALRQGPAGKPGTVEVGAVTFPRQAEIIEDHVSDARDKGARILTGGKLKDGPGRFYEPTVMTDVDHSMKVMTEETFGPVLPIMKVRDAEEGVRMANDSRYGLNSSVFTKDIAKGERIADQIEAGSTTVNDCCTNYAAQELPFGGWNESGIGARHGAPGIRKYCKTHAVLVTRFAMSRELHYYPYSPRITKLIERITVLLHGRGAKKKRKT
jgi:acyl-CoA reductase-like NAD-dependent aldehyde dehydrogenase